MYNRYDSCLYQLYPILFSLARTSLHRPIMTGIAEITHITDMTVDFTSNILFSLVKQRTSLHRPIMTGIAEITHITRMTVVFTSNIQFSLVRQITCFEI